MPASSARGSLLLVGLVSLGALAWCLGGIGRGAPPLRQEAAQPDSAPGPKPDLVKKFNLATTCVRCHNIREGDANPPDGTDEYQLPPLVKLNEYRTWLEQDKHRGAYAALEGERGAEMGRLLGIDVTSHDACLACHAPGVLVDNEKISDAEVTRRKNEGISCVSCHGPYNEWVENHWQPSELWRDKDFASKQREYGLTPLRDPAERSRLCLSCHAGNAEDGRVITHTMYAAGHPPLPSFDTATFSRSEPPHWWTPAEVPAFTGPKATEELLKNFHADLEELPYTKLAVVGGTVALREAMLLLASQAASSPPAADEALPTGGKGWPDLAYFECYACHHELEAPGYKQWRQRRGFEHRLLDGSLVTGPAGRPQIRPWPTALVRAAIHQAGGGGSGVYDANLTALFAATDAQPFGSAPALAKSAKAMATWADLLLGQLQATKFDQQAVPGLLRTLATLPETEAPDYDTARQIAWALSVIYSEWDPKPEHQADIERILNRMRSRLKLDPFTSRSQWAQAASIKEPEQMRDERLKASEGELLLTLLRAADYSPLSFRSDLQKLLQLLPAE